MLSLIKNLTTLGSARTATNSTRKAPRRGYRPAIEGLEGRISLTGGMVAAVTSIGPTPTGNTGGNH